MTDEQLAEQNNLEGWSYCTDRGLRHQWVPTAVDPKATPEARAHAEREGWYVCRRCPATAWGEELR